jgi:hypothetical protein
MTETWTVNLMDGSTAWGGALDEAWLLFQSYNVTGLVKG